MPLKYCTIHASLKSIQGDGADAGREPDKVPLKQLKFVFVLDVDSRDVLRDVVTDEIYVPMPIEAKTNDAGDLVDDYGTGVQILASNNLDLAPSNGFTCTVTITSPTNPEFGRRVITFVPYADTPEKPFTQLARVVRVPPSPGAAVLDWQQAVHQTQESVAEVKAIRDQVASTGGQAGQSAYQIAVANGFVGTQTQWLASLKGGTGTAGTITEVTAEPLAAGATPTVVLGGTSTARTIALGIPAAAPGTAGTITAITATALAAGATPTATLGGTPSARTIALGIPSAPANSGTEIAEADIVDETDNTPALVSGRRVAAAVATQTGDHQFVYYDPINGWDAARQSARARTFRSAPHTVPANDEPTGMGPFDDWEFE